MAFTPIPVDGSASPIPMSSAVPDGTNTPLTVEGGPTKITGGNSLVPVAVYEYDGYDVTQGNTLDTAVTGDNTGTVSAKLRGLSKIFADIWDGTNHWIQVKVMNANANGQAAMASSAPVVIANNQTPIPVTGDTAIGAALSANAQLVGMKAFGTVLTPLQSSGFNISSESIDHLLATGLYVYTNVGGAFTADLMRHPSVFKTASATATGNTAVWTPTTGKKFRIMRYFLQVTQNAAQATAGVITIQFQDATTNLNLAHSVFVPATAGTTMGMGFSTGWIDIGNGYLSTTANNVLNINLSTALTAGVVRVTVVGTEE